MTAELTSDEFLRLQEASYEGEAFVAFLMVDFSGVNFFEAWLEQNTSLHATVCRELLISKLSAKKFRAPNIRHDV